MRLLAGLLLAACTPHRAPLASCADPLGGTWKDAQGRGWQLIDRGATVDVYPLFDTATEPLLATDGPDAGPARSPIRVALPRKGAIVDGEASFRLTRAGKTCEVRYPFRVERCAGRAAVLSYQEVTAISDGCSAAYSPVWNDVPIARE